MAWEVLYENECKELNQNDFLCRVHIRDTNNNKIIRVIFHQTKDAVIIKIRKVNNIPSESTKLAEFVNEADAINFVIYDILNRYGYIIRGI